jgi:uncharacterized protein YdhG (YjbR/CyaY superfamily)
MTVIASITSNTFCQAVREEVSMSDTTKKSTAATGNKDKGFTADEKAAMKERAKELKAEARASKDKEAGENDALAKIAEMPEPERTMAKKLHEIIKANGPDLAPKTWYGQPAYANKDGKIVCFFQSAKKFDTRYATLGFNEEAKLDDGAMWPTAFALKELTPAVEKKIAELVKKAVS